VQEQAERRRGPAVAGVEAERVGRPGSSRGRPDAGEGGRRAEGPCRRGVPGEEDAAAEGHAGEAQRHHRAQGGHGARQQDTRVPEGGPREGGATTPTSLAPPYPLY